MLTIVVVDCAHEILKMKRVIIIFRLSNLSLVLFIAMKNMHIVTKDQKAEISRIFFFSESVIII